MDALGAVALAGIATPGQPVRSLWLVGAVAGGVVLGTLSGLVPGLHANNFALLLAGAAERVPGPPVLVAAAMLAAGVVHTFLDVVPATALGVPDPAMAAGALPAHRLVAEGRGPEALRLSALGSAGAVAAAALLALPVTQLVETVYPVLRGILPLVLGGAALALVVSEPTWRRRIGGVCSLAASTVLGAVALDLPVEGPVAGDVLAPLFAGLFGVPVLLDALAGGDVPPQPERRVALAPGAVAGLAALGTLAGAAVGYLPGVSSAVAATLALSAVPGRYGARGFVVATSAVNTANTAFATCALLALGTPRTGVLVAVERAAGVPPPGPLVVAVGVASAAGFVLVLVVGDVYLRAVRRADYARLSAGVLCLLVVVSYLLSGPVGVGVLGAAAAVGRIPVRFSARRAHLMGVLLGPIALGL
jgi:putative membrane protein